MLFSVFVMLFVSMIINVIMIDLKNISQQNNDMDFLSNAGGDD